MQRCGICSIVIHKAVGHKKLRDALWQWDARSSGEHAAESQNNPLKEQDGGIRSGQGVKLEVKQVWWK